MANRVTAAEVKVLVETGKSDADVGIFIDAANLIVNEEVVPKASMSEARLKLIELYLAAHFLTVTEERGGLLSSETGQSAESYVGAFTSGVGLALSRYGQQAIDLDKSGVLSGMSGGTKKAQFRVVGGDCPTI